MMKRIRLILIDGTGVISALLLAAAVRFEGNIPEPDLLLIALALPSVVVGKIIALFLFRCYRWSFKYAGLPELRSFLSAISLGTLLSWAFTYLVGPAGVSRGALLLEPLFSLFILGAYRFGFRVLPERRSQSRPQIDGVPSPGRKVLIIGAGDAGVMTLREIRKHPQSGMDVIGFIDDDSDKKGEWINGIRVIGGREEIPDAVEALKIDELIIAIPSAGGETIRELIAACREVKTRFRVVPGLFSIIQGDVDFERIREIRPEDLLGRETTEIRPDQFGESMKGKRVLITGAGGSIGSEIARQIQAAGGRLILLDHSEVAMYMILEELKSLGPTIGYVADIRNRPRIEHIMEKERPEIVFHAAAYKHVPLMEENASEAITTNFFGTKFVAEAASRIGVSRFVLISTDKAVRPTSVMGATKRAAELWLLEHFSETASIVRFGNVFGSSGSAPLLFRKQIEAGGPVTVTHPHVVRFFMTIHEAVFLVIQASLMGNGLFVLEMGQPIRILDLARNMITLSGLRPEIDIPIVFSGLRPGEKLFEEVLTDGENIAATPLPKIFRITRDTPPPASFPDDVSELEAASVRVCDEGRQREILRRMVTDYRVEAAQ